jgi:hypothetical protein
MALLVSLRNVHRAAEMARAHLIDHAAKEMITDALAAFDSQLPGLVHARDVVEHFDEYRVGRGRLQQKGAAAGRAFDELAEHYAPRLEYGGRDYPRMTVGDFVLDLSRAEPAVLRLVEDLWSAISFAQRDRA